MLYRLFRPIEQRLANGKHGVIAWGKRTQWPVKLIDWFYRTIWFKPCQYYSKRCTPLYYMRPCCRKLLLETFDDVTTLLDTHDVRYWVGCGSLLGALRDQDIIPWDTDIDLYVLSEDIEPIMGLIRTHLTPKRLTYISSPYYSRVCISLTNHNGIDLFVLHPHATDDVRYFRLYGDNQTTYEIPNVCLESMDTATFAGRQIKIPLHAEALMKLVYGHDWRVPKKYFSIIKHNLGSMDEFYVDIQQEASV